MTFIEDIKKIEIPFIKKGLSSFWTYIIFAIFMAPLFLDGGYYFDQILILCGLFFLFALLFVIDMKYMVLPDILTLSGTILGVLISPAYIGISLLDSLLGAIGGFILFYIILWGIWRVKGVDGMGFGDVKLLAMLGAWFGVSFLPFLLLTVSTLALVGFLLHALFINSNGRRILPFGPFLVVGAWVTLFYATPLWMWVIINLRMLILGDTS